MPRFWKRITIAAIGAIVGEIGARIVLPGIVSQALADYLRRGDAGFLLRLYDRLVGGGASRGAVLALGILPYVSALVYTAIARRLGVRLSRNGTRGLTAVLSLVQGYGFARFAESIPGVVAHPGAAFIAQTMVLLTSSTLVAVALTEALFDREPDEEATEAEAQVEEIKSVGPGPLDPVAVRQGAERARVD